MAFGGAARFSICSVSITSGGMLCIDRFSSSGHVAGMNHGDGSDSVNRVDSSMVIWSNIGDVRQYGGYADSG